MFLRSLGSGLFKNDTLRSADFAMSSVSIDYDDLECFC